MRRIAILKAVGLMIGISACMFTLSTLVSILIYGGILYREPNLAILWTEIALATAGIAINTVVLLYAILKERDSECNS